MAKDNFEFNWWGKGCRCLEKRMTKVFKKVAFMLNVKAFNNFFLDLKKYIYFFLTLCKNTVTFCINFYFFFT